MSTHPSPPGVVDAEYTLTPDELDTVTAACVWRLGSGHDVDLVTREWLGAAIAHLTGTEAALRGVTFGGPTLFAAGVAATVHRSLDLYVDHGPDDDTRTRAQALSRRLYRDRLGL